MAKVSLILDTRKTSRKKDGTYPIALSVYHKKPRYIGLKFYTTILGWDALNCKLRKSAACNRIHSAAIFIGPHGLGKWQKVELRSLISQFVEKDIPVIPVLLPSVETIPEEQLFLRAFTQIKFNTPTDKIALNRLIKDINRCRPNPTSTKN